MFANQLITSVERLCYAFSELSRKRIGFFSAHNSKYRGTILHAFQIAVQVNLLLHLARSIGGLYEKFFQLLTVRSLDAEQMRAGCPRCAPDAQWMRAISDAL